MCVAIKTEAAPTAEGQEPRGSYEAERLALAPPTDDTKNL